MYIVLLLFQYIKNFRIIETNTNNKIPVSVNSPLLLLFKMVCFKFTPRVTVHMDT
jgi:hypothetical protein